MPWTGDWSSVDGNRQAEAEQLRQAMLERALIGGVTPSASLQSPFEGRLKRRLASGLNGLLNEILDGFAFPWTLATLLAAIGASEQVLPVAGELKQSAWAKQLYDMINLMTVTVAVGNGAFNNRLSVAQSNTQRRNGSTEAQWLAAPWVPGGNSIKDQFATHWADNGLSRISRIKATYDVSNYVHTTTLNHQSTFFRVFGYPTGVNAFTAQRYENNDFPVGERERAVSIEQTADAAPNTRNAFPPFIFGAFETVTTFPLPLPPGPTSRLGWQFRPGFASVVTNWQVVGGLTFVA